MDGMIYASDEEAQAGHEAEQERAEKERKAKIVRLARDRFTAAEEAESEIRQRAAEDLRFRAGQQWDPRVLAQRQADKRPALVINRTTQFERQVTNEQRQAKPAIKVSPVDSGADRETADIFQGLIRHIEYDSGADAAYDTSLVSAVRGGLGYFRLITEYEAEDSFYLKLSVKRVRDPASVYLDPAAQEADRSDAEWGFIVGDGVSEERFKAEHPDCEPAKGGWGNQTSTNGGSCQVVEYFYRERTDDEVLMLAEAALDETTGRPVPVGEPVTVFASDAAASPERYAGHVVMGQRPTKRIRVKWVKIAGDTVIEETEFPSRWIPIFPVLGDEIYVDGKLILESLIRNMRDSQRMYNVMASSIVETIGLAPKAPWVGVKGQFAGVEHKWAQASSRNIPYLEYEAKTIGGTLAPPPQRQAFEAPIAAMTQAMMFASDDMKATTGIYDSALGNRSNEQSGRAINARKQGSQTATYHFPDNLARALRHAGRVMVDAIPRVYSDARIVRILGEDQAEKMVAINGAPPPKGQHRAFDLGAGTYDVTVSMGPSFATKRQEAAETQMEFIQAYPNAAALIGDLLAENMDWPGAEKIAKRLKRALPPGIAEPDESQKADPAQLMSALQQMQQQGQHYQQMIDQLSQSVHVLQDQLDSKDRDNATKERIALIQTQATLAATAAKLDSEEALAMLEHQVALITKRLELDGINEPAEGQAQESATP